MTAPRFVKLALPTPGDVVYINIEYIISVESGIDNGAIVCSADYTGGGIDVVETPNQVMSLIKELTK